MDEPPNAYLILFLLGILTDLIWTLTIKAANKSKIHFVALGNALLAAITLASAYWCIESKSLVDMMCYVIGCFLGTYLAHLVNETCHKGPQPKGKTVKKVVSKRKKRPKSRK